MTSKSMTASPPKRATPSFTEGSPAGLAIGTSLAIGLAAFFLYHTLRRFAVSHGYWEDNELYPWITAFVVAGISSVFLIPYFRKREKFRHRVEMGRLKNARQIIGTYYVCQKLVSRYADKPKEITEVIGLKAFSDKPATTNDAKDSPTEEKEHLKHLRKIMREWGLPQIPNAVEPLECGHKLWWLLEATKENPGPEIKWGVESSLWHSKSLRPYPHIPSWGSIEPSLRRGNSQDQESESKKEILGILWKAALLLAEPMIYEAEKIAADYEKALQQKKEKTKQAETSKVKTVNGAENVEELGNTAIAHAENCHKLLSSIGEFFRPLIQAEEVPTELFELAKSYWAQFKETENRVKGIKQKLGGLWRSRGKRVVRIQKEIQEQKKLKT